jgi:hypothetical protein
MIYPPSKPLSSCPAVILLLLLTCLCFLCKNLIYQPLPDLPAPPPTKRQSSQPSTSPPNRVINPPEKNCHFHQRTSGHIANSLNRAFAKDLSFPPQVLWSITKPFQAFVQPPTLPRSTSMTYYSYWLRRPPPAPNIQMMMTTHRASKAQEAREEQLKVLQQIKQQLIVQKQQRDKDCKQAELKVKQCQDTKSAEQAALARSQKTTVPAPSSQDQYDPDINCNLFNLNSNTSDDAPEPTD